MKCIRCESVSGVRQYHLNPNGVFGKEALYFDRVTSTNDIAAEMASKGCRHGLVVLADSQTHGRGRGGNVWISPENDNLYFSIVFYSPFQSTEAPILTLMSAVSVVLGIQRHTSMAPSIKWPNDIMLNGKKLGGILAESKLSGDVVKFAIVGVGLNVNLDISVLPLAIREIATSLKHETGQIFSRESLLKSILSAFDYWYDQLCINGKSSIIQAWKSLNVTLGKTVRITSPQGVLSGLAIDVSENGELFVQANDGTIRAISAGDVIHT